MPANWDGTPKTWSTGELVTASDMNGELRDRMEYLYGLSRDSYVLIRDEKTSGTAGGGFTNGAFQTRDLNVEVADAGNLATLSSNQITLGAGTYYFRAHAPAYRVNAHQLRLQNVTDAATLAEGSSASASNASSVETVAVLEGLFTLAGTRTLELQHRGQTTQATNGYGLAHSWGTEIYAVLEIWKVGE